VLLWHGAAGDIGGHLVSGIVLSILMLLHREELLAACSIGKIVQFLSLGCDFAGFLLCGTTALFQRLVPCFFCFFYSLDEHLWSYFVFRGVEEQCRFNFLFLWCEKTPPIWCIFCMVWMNTAGQYILFSVMRWNTARLISVFLVWENTAGQFFLYFYGVENIAGLIFVFCGME
jgi:hypothetical protein